MLLVCCKRARRCMAERLQFIAKETDYAVSYTHLDVYKRQEYVEAKRLLKFLDYFLGVSSEDIPRNSIVREFIGGSCFNV